MTRCTKLFASNDEIAEYSFDDKCEKVAVLTCPGESMDMNIIDIYGNLLIKKKISDNNSTSYALLNQRAWLNDESIVFSKFISGKFEVVLFNTKSGQSTVLTDGKGPIVIDDTNGEKILYLEKPNRIVSISKNAKQKKIIKEYPEGFSIGRLHANPDYNGLIFKLMDQTGTKFISKYVFLNLDTLGETELALNSDDFVSISLSK